MAPFVWPTHTSTVVFASWYGPNSLYILERGCGWNETKATVVERKFKSQTSTFFKKASLFPHFFLGFSLYESGTNMQWMPAFLRRRRTLSADLLSSSFSLPPPLLQIHKLALRLMNHFAFRSRQGHGIDLMFRRKPWIVISLFAKMSGSRRIAQRGATWAKCQGLQLSTSPCHWFYAVITREEMYFFSENLHVFIFLQIKTLLNVLEQPGQILCQN